MKINDEVQCSEFPCSDVRTEGYLVPQIDIDPEEVTIIMISEVNPPDPQDHFYAAGTPFYLETTLQAFNDCGANVSSIEDILSLGVYITTAVKCAKTDYSISSDTIANCAGLLGKELSLFSNVRVIMLMGDVAIKAMNQIAQKRSGKRIIPKGSTYKIRKTPYYYGNIRVFPSYILTGKSFLIEKSKRRMIAEDIAEALSLIK